MGLARWIRRTIADPRIVRHLLADEGEVVVDEVRHHWVVYILPLLEAAAALIVFGLMVVVDLSFAWVPFAIGLFLLGFAAWKALEWHMDRFVITNMRVFRVSGVLTKKVATTPIMRILDITVDKPFVGRILGYGHFIFESAAQEQGLRDIRYVGKPDQRDLTIQRLLQRSGLRATAKENENDNGGEDDGSESESSDSVSAPTVVRTGGGRPKARHPRLPGPPSARRISR